MTEECGESFLDSGITCGLPHGHPGNHEAVEDVLRRRVTELEGQGAAMGARQERDRIVRTLREWAKCVEEGCTMAPTNWDPVTIRTLRRAANAIERQKVHLHWAK